AVLLAIGVVVSLVAPGQAVRSLGALVLLLGAVLLVPPLLSPLARVLGAVTRRLAPGVGDIAVMHLVKERSRSAYTLALVMVVLAMIISVGATNQALGKTLDAIVDRQAGRNVQVFAAGAFDPVVEEQLATVDGVTTTTPIRFGMTDVLDAGGEPTETFATVVDPATYFDVASFAWVDGDDESARAALAAGGSVLLPDSTVARLEIELGDEVDVRTAAGVQAFELAGTYAILGPGFGLVAGVADVESFGAGRPNGFLLGFDDGADPELIRRQILTEVLPNQGAFVDTTDMVRDRARTQLSTFFSLGYATLAIAAIVGMLGLANTLIVSVITRTREVGVLRSIGVRRRQVRGMVLVEAVTLALVALALAIPLSAVLAAGIINGQRATLGFTVDFLFPWALVPVLGLVTLLLAGLASLLPARRAGRMEIVTALRFD
ncbi:MAG: ABC transporter permease, partial [Actinomycetota bacterium]